VKNARRIAIVLFILLCLGVVGFYFLAQEYLNSEKFQALLVSECKKRLHCQIKLDKASPSHAWKIYVKNQKLYILGAVDLNGVHFSSSTHPPQEWMYADSLRLRYDLYEAMFHQKILLEEIRLVRPQVDINLQTVLPETKSEVAPAVTHEVKPSPINEIVAPPHDESLASKVESPPPAIPPSKEIMPWVAPPELDLGNFIFEGGRIQIHTLKKVLLEDANGKISFSSSPVPSIAGSLECKTVKLLEDVQLSDNHFSFLWRSDCMMIPSFSIGFLDGKITGSFRADRTKTTPQFKSHLSVQNVSVEKIHGFWKKSKGEIRGKIKAEMSIHGELVKSQRLAAEGTVKIEDARMVNFTILNIMSSYLRQPEFLELSLSECEFDFILDHPKLNIPRIKIISKDLELTGKGSVNLLQGTQSFDLTMLVSANLHPKFPETVWEGLHKRPDGRIELPIKVWGDVNHPQNDAEARFKPIVPRAVGGAIFDRIFQGLPDAKN
jgi:hypothetical protein